MKRSEYVKEDEYITTDIYNGEFFLVHKVEENGLTVKGKREGNDVFIYIPDEDETVYHKVYNINSDHTNEKEENV